jgi:hypothetical protein
MTYIIVCSAHVETEHDKFYTASFAVDASSPHEAKERIRQILVKRLSSYRVCREERRLHWEDDMEVRELKPNELLMIHGWGDWFPALAFPAIPS